uniref:Uncharacterized protein n=1 Tax=Kryptolebias marmoratus TaxID=37003 RepID=A0A3Q3B442_KRYMA
MIGDGEPREIPGSITAQDILIPPEIEMEATCRERVTVRVGHNINIFGYIKARPDPEVIWSKEDTVLENSKRVTLVQNLPMVHLRIKEATRNDHGKYTLKASNVGGEASCTITVNVLDRPGHCQNLHLTYVTKASCMINWEAPDDNGGSEITNYIVECREPSISGWSMISSNCTNRKIKAKLMEGHEYLFRVCAVNKLGPGPAVELKSPLLAIDPIEKPGEPENFRATDIGKNFVYLRWRKPDYDGGSPNLSYNLEYKWKKPDYDGGSRNLGYHIEKKPKEADEWERLHKGAIKETYFMADRCIENQIYQFRVQTKNEGGESNWVTTGEVLVKEQLVEPEVKIKLDGSLYGSGVPRATPTSYLASDPVSKYLFNHSTSHEKEKLMLLSLTKSQVFFYLIKKQLSTHPFCFQASQIPVRRLKFLR